MKSERFFPKRRAAWSMSSRCSARARKLIAALRMASSGWIDNGYTNPKETCSYCQYKRQLSHANSVADTWIPLLEPSAAYIARLPLHHHLLRRAVVVDP